jgi:hypothetical protein
LKRAIVYRDVIGDIIEDDDFHHNFAFKEIKIAFFTISITVFPFFLFQSNFRKLKKDGFMYIFSINVYLVLEIIKMSTHFFLKVNPLLPKLSNVMLLRITGT